MKKPEIDMQSKRMMVETKVHSDMIDNLTKAYYELIAVQSHDGKVGSTERVIKGIKEVLIKAGCKL